MRTQSLLSILIGGVAFETPANGPLLPAAEAKTLFTLYGDRAKAFEPAARNPQTYQLIFKESVRGLAPGAPVEFRGIPIGELAEVRAQVDLKTFEFSVPVTIRLDPQRLGVRVIDTKSGADLETMRRNLIFLAPEMVERIVAGRQPPELTAQSLQAGRFDIPVAGRRKSEPSDLRSRSEHAPISSGPATTFPLFEVKRQIHLQAKSTAKSADREKSPKLAFEPRRERFSGGPRVPDSGQMRVFHAADERIPET